MATTLLNKDFITRAGLRVEGTAPVTSSTNNTGSVQINSGIAVAGNMIVASTATFYGPTTINNTLTVLNSVSAPNFYGVTSTATNIAGSFQGSIPIQSSTGTTAFIPLGTNGQVLLVNGSTASWSNLSSVSVGLATTATNLAGGLAGEIPYQSNIGTTLFTVVGIPGQPLVSNGSNAPIFSSSLTLTSLTSTNLIVTSQSALANATATSLSVTLNVTATTFYGNLVGTATTATTATNIANGPPGGIPIQSSTGTTAFIPLGTNGQVLLVNGSTATWNNLSSVSVGLATTATNLAGGASGVVPYQSSTGTTQFTSVGISGQPMISGGSGAPTFVSSLTLTTLTATSNVYITGNAAATSTVSGALQVIGGVGIQGTLWAQQIVIPNNGLFTIQRSAGQQYFTIEDDDITGSAYIRSYSSSTAAKILYYESRTDTFPTNPTAGSLGHAFLINGNTALTINWSTITSALAGTVISGGIQSTASSNGTLVVQGGVGISQNLFVGGTINGILSGTASTATNLAGGVPGAIVYQSATNYTSFSNTGTVGQIFVSGGTGAPIFVSSLTLSIVTATTLYVTTNAIMANITATNITGTSLTISGPTILSALTATNITGTNLSITNNAVITGTTAIFGVLAVNSTASSTGQGTGALQVSGGASITGSLYVGNTTYITGDLYVDGTQFTVNKSFIASGDNTITLSTGSTSSASLANGAGLQIGTTSSPWITWLFDGASNWVSSSGIKVNSTASTNNATSGALQVAGGVGISGGLYVGNYVTATYHVGYLGGPTSAIGTNGSNLYGGSAGVLVYQTGTNATGFLSTGTHGQLLSMNNGLPAWVSISNLTAGNATTATNLAGGSTGSIPYQASSGTTVFAGNLSFDAVKGVFSTTNISINGGTGVTGTNSTSTITGALVVYGGVGITQDVYVGGAVYVGGEKIGGNTGTFVNLVVTGTGFALTVTNNVYIAGTLTSVTTVTNNALYVTGGVGISSTLYANTANIFSTAQSTSTVTGALTVAGGVGVGGNIYFNGNLYQNGVLFTSGTTSTTSTFLITNTSTSNSTNTGALVVYGGIGVGAGIFVGGIITTTNLVVSGSITAPLVVSNTLAATSTSTGSLVVYGGVGIGGALYVQQTSYINGSPIVTTATIGNYYSASTSTLVAGTYTVSLSSSTGVLTIPNTLAGASNTGSVVISSVYNVTTSNWTFGYNGTTGTITFPDGTNQLSAWAPYNQVNITNTNSSTSTTTGALVVSGGVGIGQNIYVGGVGYFGPQQSTIGLANPLMVLTNNVNNYTQIQIQNISSGTYASSDFIATTNNGTDSSNYIDLGINNSNFSTSTWTISGGNDGYLYVDAGNLTLGTDTPGKNVAIHVGGTLASNIVATFNSTTNTTSTNTGALTIAGGIGVSGGVFVGGTITSTNIIVNGATSSTSTTTGALQVTGGVGIGGNLYQTGSHVIQNATSSTTTTTGALVVSGGAGIGGNVNVGGTITVGPTVTGTSVLSFLGNNFAEASYTSNLITATQANIAQTLDLFTTSSYRTAEYLVQITDTGTTPASIHVEKLLVFQDGVNVYETEYAIMTNNGELGTFSTAYTGTNVAVFFTPTNPQSMTVKMVRFALTL